MRVTRKFKDTHANTVLGDNLKEHSARIRPEFVIEIKTLNIVSYDPIAGKFSRLQTASFDHDLLPSSSVPPKRGLITCPTVLARR
jgi:hypothetical protein